MPDGSLSLYPGMSALLDAISTSSQGTVQLSSEVTEIFWREGLVGVNYRNRSLDSAVTARRLIVTIPPSVLRRRGPSFTPALPGAKLQAMEEVVSRDAISVAAVFPADSAAFVDDAEVLIEAQFRGSRADLLSRQPDEVVFSMALREYGDGLVTVPAYEEALWTERVNWAADPDSRGARLEAASARTRLTLAESVGATLFFAGDTTVAAAGVGDIAAVFASRSTCYCRRRTPTSRSSTCFESPRRRVPALHDRGAGH